MKGMKNKFYIEENIRLNSNWRQWYKRNSWETKMCPCTNFVHWPEERLNVSVQIFVRNGNCNHLAASIDWSRYSSYTQENKR